MSGVPWFKCFPADFLNGVADLAPNELAVYTICLMRMYDEGGDIPDDAERIAKRCNMRPTTCQKAIDALCEAGKMHRMDGRLLNGRVEKEIKSRQKVSEKSAHSAQSRWEKRPEKDSKINGAAMRTHEKPDADDMLSRSQKPEARTDANASDARAGFAEWYAAYPHKVGKAAAEKAYTAARRKVDQRTLLDAVSRYIRDKPPDRSYCNPATWLNQERWLDQPAPQSAGPPKPAPYRPPANLVTAEDLQRH